MKLPKGLQRYVIKTNWPTVNVRHHEFVASSADKAWQKFVRQRFGALKPDRREWSINVAGSEVNCAPTNA